MFIALGASSFSGHYAPHDICYPNHVYTRHRCKCLVCGREKHEFGICSSAFHLGA